jgi:hypothetical protein
VVPGDAPLRVLDRRPGRVAGEERVVLAGSDGNVAARGLWFHGRLSAGIRPWADLVAPDLSVLGAVAAALGPGGSLMVAYDADATDRALRRKVPPAATPVGLALLTAGCRWFKDWYFSEGGREGGTKLQGTLPLDDEHRVRAEAILAVELHEFLARAGVRDVDRRAAQDALATLGR